MVLHIGGNRWVIGEPSDKKTPRAQAVVDLFNKAGLTAEISPDLRGEIFRKLTGNAAGNTRLGTHAPGSLRNGERPGLRTVSMGIMRETLAVAAALGWDLRSEIDVEKIATRASPGPASTPSMLQDVLFGRGLEIEAHIGQTQALGA